MGVIKLTPEEKDFIIINLEGGENLINNDDISELLTLLDAWLTANGFDDNWDLTDRGRDIQRIYDNIYYNNLD